MLCSPAARRIKAAFLELLEENPDGPITVTQIAQRAHVNRVTFYRLYETQEAVLFDILAEFDQRIESDMADIGRLYSTDGTPEVRGLLEYHRSNMPMLCTVLKSSFAPILERRIEDGVRDPMRRMSDYLEQDSPFMDELFLSFYSAGIGRVMCDWIRGGCRQSVDEIVQFLFQAFSYYEG